MPYPRITPFVCRPLALAFVLVLCEFAHAQDITSNLRGHWRLDETSGATATDASGQGANGTYTGTMQLGKAGHVGNCVGFSDNGGTTDRVSLPYTVLNGQSDVTLSFWIRTTDTNYHAIISAANGVTDNEYYVFIDTGNLLKVRYEGNSNTESWTLTGVYDGNWHHIAVVSNESANTTTAYMDGASLGSKSITIFGSFSVSSGGLFLCQDQDSVGGGFDSSQRMIGDLDQIRIYGRALTTTEVGYLYRDGSPVAHWKLNETSGTSAADTSGLTNTGTVTGTTSWTSAIRNNGFSFNGATKIQATGLLGKSRDFSVAAWANLTTADSSGAEIVSLGDCVILRLDEGGVASCKYYNGSTWESVSLSGTFVGKGWHHFAATFDDANNSFLLYADGSQVASAAPTTSVSYSGLGSNTVVGRHGNSSTIYDFTGILDDVRVYIHPLSASQVAELYGFVGHWKLNHTSGTTATDSSQFASHGTVTGGASWSTDCGGNATFDFDNSTKYISVTNGSHLQPTESLTIAAWIKADTWGATTIVDTILRKGDSDPNNYKLSVADGKLELGLDDNDDAGIQSATTLSTGTWYHVAGTWDGTTAKVYVNGVLDSSTAQSGTIGTSTGSVRIGGRSGGDYFDGMIRDVRLYNRALSASDILSLAGSSGRWQFAEGTGSSAADSSGAGNNATLSGGATWTTDCAGTPALLTNGSGGIAQTGTSFSPPEAGTLSFWMKPTAMPASTGRVMGLTGDWEVRQLSTGVVYFDLCGDGGSDFYTTTALSDTTRWYHVVATFDASNDSYAVYVDGTLQKSGTNSSAMTQQTAAILSFGTRTGSTEYWNGALRDVRVYSRKLCASEIAELYGLAGHWKLDESSGSTAADSSGLGNTGALTGTVTWTAAADNNGAKLIYTDGDDYFTIANSSSLQDVQENNYTVMAWFKPLSVPPGSGSANDANYAIVAKTGWHIGLLYTSSRQFELDHYLSGYTWVGTGTWSDTYAANKYYHVAGVVNRIAGTSKIYVDGVLKNTATFTANGAAPEYGTTSWYIGIASPGAASWKWSAHAVVDDARIYNRALCPTEIQTIYNSGSPFEGVKIIKWVEIQ